MWSKTKKALMERTADNLKKRVRYNFEVYTTKRRHSEMAVFYIYVDNELWFATNPNDYLEEYKYLDKYVNKGLPHHEYRAVYNKVRLDAYDYATEYGLMNVNRMMLYVHRYLNVYSVKECLDSENYMLKMLAVLNRRIGKRTVGQLVDNISNEPEWFRKFIILCAKSEGVRCQTFGEKNGSMGL